MKRRAFLATAGSLILGSAMAQSKREPTRVGWLHFGSRSDRESEYAAFKAGMLALGWKEGEHYAMVERWADDRADRLAVFAEQIAASKPAVIVAVPGSAVLAALKAAPRTPIVMANGADPVSSGFTTSLSHPSSTVTGLSNNLTDLGDKFPELLLAAAPGVRRIGFLDLAKTSVPQGPKENVKRLSKLYSIDGRIFDVKSSADIGPALARYSVEGVQALVVMVHPLLFAERKQIAQGALRRKWPVIGFNSAFADAGALMSYGPNFAEQVRRAAHFVDRILKGARPADLPFEEPTQYELVVNLNTAKALGLKIPQSLVLRADRMIE
jgi:putative ABC transport system substrate-binding protein